MKIVETTDPGVLELRSKTVGCVVFAGFVFCLGGAALLSLAFFDLPLPVTIDPEVTPFALGAGAILLILGLLFMGGRSATIVDRRQQAVIKWSGIFVPLRRKTIPLGHYSQVRLTKEVRRTQNSSTTYYPVRLRGAAEKDLTIESATDYLESRRIAEALAKTMNWPLSDDSSGEEIVREANQLDESLRDRMRRLGQKVEIPPQPHSMRSQAQITSSEVHITIPGMNTTMRRIMNLGAIALGAVVFLMFFGIPTFRSFQDFGPEKIMPLVFGALFVLIPLAILATRFGSFNRPVTVTADRSRLVVEDRRRTEIPGDELEELSIAGRDFDDLFQTKSDGSMTIDPKQVDRAFTRGTGTTGGAEAPSIPPALAGLVRSLTSMSSERIAILARSDQASVSFGRGLDRDELSYLYSAILRVLVE